VPVTKASSALYTWASVKSHSRTTPPAAARRDDAGLRDALEAVGAGAGPEFAAAHDEEVGAVAAGDEAARVEHQRLVGTGS
jgi:hypothetical protein